jgi:hypothetical protein
MSQGIELAIHAPESLARNRKCLRQRDVGTIVRLQTRAQVALRRPGREDLTGPRFGSCELMRRAQASSKPVFCDLAANSDRR